MKTNRISTKEYGSFRIFNKREQIRKLAQKESDYFWGQNKERVSIPKVNLKVERLPFSVGAWNLVRQIVYDFRP